MNIIAKYRLNVADFFLISFAFIFAAQVMVETTLDKERLKEAILTCTNRVS